MLPLSSLVDEDAEESMGPCGVLISFKIRVSV